MSNDNEFNDDIKQITELIVNLVAQKNSEVLHEISESISLPLSQRIDSLVVATASLTAIIRVTSLQSYAMEAMKIILEDALVSDNTVKFDAEVIANKAFLLAKTMCAKEMIEVQCLDKKVGGNGETIS